MYGGIYDCIESHANMYKWTRQDCIKNVLEIIEEYNFVNGNEDDYAEDAMTVEEGVIAINEFFDDNAEYSLKVYKPAYKLVPHDSLVIKTLIAAAVAVNLDNLSFKKDEITIFKITYFKDDWEKGWKVSIMKDCIESLYDHTEDRYVWNTKQDKLVYRDTMYHIE